MKRKQTKFVQAKLLSDNNYSQVEVLNKFLTDQGKIMGRRFSKLTIRDQKRMTKELKRIRALGLLPFTTFD